MSSVHVGKQRRSTISLLVSVFFVLSFATGCGLGAITNQINASTQQAIAAIDDAIAKLGNANADWQNILGDLENKIPGTEQTIKNDVSDVLTHAVGAAGTQVTCVLDFIVTRVREGLIRIKAKVLGQTVPPVEPSFCDANPAAVDASRVPGDLKFIEFFGYNFDTNPAIQVFLQNGSQQVDVTNFLDKPSHYHMTLKFGANGVQLSSNSERFIVKWNDNEVSTIGIIQSATPVCATRVSTFNPAGIDFIPPHTKGDADFAGHGPNVTASVSLSNFSTRIVANIQMTAVERESDYTTASGSMSKEIFTIDPGWRVEKIIGTTTANFSYTDSNTTPDTFQVGGDSPVSTFTFVGDSSGDDAGINTKVTVGFNTLRLLEVQTNDCVSPYAIKVVQLQNALSAATMQRLKPQIDTMPRDIQNVLPQVNK